MANIFNLFFEKVAFRKLEGQSVLQTDGQNAFEIPQQFRNIRGPE